MSKLKDRSQLIPLLVICLAFTLLVAMHTTTTPLFEAPDEIWHYAYVRWIAEGNGLPPLDEDLSGANQEAAQPPLYYLVAAALTHPFEDADLGQLLWHNPDFGYQAPGIMPDNKNMLIHTAAEAFPWRGASLAVHMARLTSWLFGLMAVVAVWLLGREVSAAPHLAITASALVAFHPQFVFISSVVSNDAAAAAVASLGLWLATRMLLRGVCWRSVVGAGVLAGLAALTKNSVLPLIPALGLSLVVAQAPIGFRLQTAQPTDHKASLGRLLGKLAFFATVTVAIGAWWYIRNTSLYGDPLGLGSHTQTQWGREDLASVSELIAEIPLLWRSYWGAYGWGHVFWPDAVYGVLTALSLPLIALTVIATAEGWWSIGHSRKPIRHLLGNLTSRRTWLLPLTLLIIWGAGIIAALLSWMRQVQAPHGRLLFPAIGAWALLTSWGLRVYASRYPQIMRAWRAILLGMLATMTALAPGARILATFAPPRLRSASAVSASCAAPTAMKYGKHIQLLCAEAPPHRVRPGETTEVRACWMTSAPLARDYTVFVHFLGPDMQRFAERHTHPGLGKYPTSLWTPHQAFCDTYQIQVEPWTDVPVRAQLEIGLFDAATGERLEAMTPSGEEAVPPIVGTVDLVSAPQPAGDSVPAALGTLSKGGKPGMYLLSAEGPRYTVPGGEVEISLEWLALESGDRDYVAFVHLWQPGDPAPLAQSDAQPRDAWFPTSAWQPGDRIPDIHHLLVPDSTPPGEYPLWAGMYDPQTGSRLSASGATESYAHSLIPIGTLTIR